MDPYIHQCISPPYPSDYLCPEGSQGIPVHVNGILVIKCPNSVNPHHPPRMPGAINSLSTANTFSENKAGTRGDGSPDKIHQSSLNI
jgi:hypothetical protein